MEAPPTPSMSRFIVTDSIAANRSRLRHLARPSWLSISSAVVVAIVVVVVRFETEIIKF